MDEYFYKMNKKLENINISVCLLVYNHDHLLSAVIDSILRQTYINYELIISDDCSSDNSWNVILEYASKYPQIKGVKTPKNLGMAENVNYAASFAKGEYIAILHHDDIVRHDLLEKWLKVIQKNDNVAFVFNDYLNKQSVPDHKAENRKFKEIMDGKTFLKKVLLDGWNCPIRGTAMIRKSCFDLINGMDIRFGMLADVDLWMRLSTRWDVGYVPEPLIYPTHDRKEDYPEEYTKFTWKRIFLLFDIHANHINHENYPSQFLLFLKYVVFRFKVSLEIIKWLLYAIVKRKKEMIIRSNESKNEYEFYIIKPFRKILIKTHNRPF
jgi:glycosyltransferase involved in cell wall biosynthesis